MTTVFRKKLTAGTKIPPGVPTSSPDDLLMESSTHCPTCNQPLPVGRANNRRNHKRKARRSLPVSSLLPELETSACQDEVPTSLTDATEAAVLSIKLDATDSTEGTPNFSVTTNFTEVQPNLPVTDSVTEVPSIPTDAIDFEEVSSSPTDATDFEETSPIPEGGVALPFGCNLQMYDVISQLMRSTNPLPHIPSGKKENCYFIVNNELNVMKREAGYSSDFHDDCGAWAAGSPSTRTYLLAREGGFTCIIKREGQYCRRKRINGTSIFLPIRPQPEPDQVLCMHRIYNKLAADASYRRRITWLSCTGVSAPAVVLVEYIGKYPGPRPHRGSKNPSQAPYIKTKREVLDAIAEEPTSTRPADLYNRLMLMKNEPGSIRSPKQIYNMRHYQKKKQKLAMQAAQHTQQ